MSEEGLSEFEDDSELEQDFAAASKHLQTIVSSIDQTHLLEFYGLYKQATIGKCNIGKPGLFALQAKAKWNAWNDLKDMSQDVAMQKYVDKMYVLRPDWQAKSNDPAERKNACWNAVSTPSNNEAEIEPSDKSCFDYAKEGDLPKLKDVLKSGLAVDKLDSDGLAMLHWAADRGHVSVVEVLLAAGCDVNLSDSDGQTALHYAASCGHADCVRALLAAGADKNRTDDEDQTCLDVSTEPIIIDLLK